MNNRNLRTFTTDLAVTEQLADLLPDPAGAGRILISESGVKTVGDIARLRTCGARGFLDRRKPDAGGKSSRIRADRSSSAR